MPWKVFFFLFSSLLLLRKYLFRGRKPLSAFAHRSSLIDRYMLDERWEEAEVEIEHLISSSMNTSLGKEAFSLELYLKRARVLSKMSLHEKALRTLSQDFDDLSEQEKCALLSSRASILLALNKTYAALDELRKAFPKYRNLTLGRIYAQIAYTTAHYGESYNALLPFIDGNSSGDLLAMCGDSLFMLGHYKRALLFYRMAWQKAYLSSAMLLRVGASLRFLGRDALAESCFRLILSWDSQQSLALWEWGACLEKRGNYRRALFLYQSHPNWQKRSPAFIYRVGICSLFLGEYGEAAKCLRELCQRKQASPRVLAALARAYEGLGDFTRVENVYRYALNKYSRYAFAYLGLARLYALGFSHQLKAVDALLCARKALEMAKTTYAWNILSACEVRCGNFRRAHEIQERLASSTQEAVARKRRQQVMRLLRKGKMLELKEMTELIGH